ncbi:MAG: hypothetical protein LBE34_03340 [Flavobacteriaceae bacterium]|nr:hypothetical protein [Flavobacteriaceae bacterium]
MNYSTQIRKANSRDYKSIMEVWESAVLSTHYFLQQDDFNRYKENLPIYFEL